VTAVEFLYIILNAPSVGRGKVCPNQARLNEKIYTLCKKTGKKQEKPIDKMPMAKN
jgi:hypothetical protein